MASTHIPSETWGSSSAPDLLPLYPPYLAAFNDHSWSGILEYLSSTCHATVRGTLVNKSAEEMRPNYEKDFALCDRHEISIKEMTQIERTVDASSGEEEEDWKKGVRWGLGLVLYDPTKWGTITLNYWYRVEDGKWMQCWHEILGSVADETV